MGGYGGGCISIFSYLNQLLWLNPQFNWNANLRLIPGDPVGPHAQDLHCTNTIPHLLAVLTHHPALPLSFLFPSPSPLSVSVRMCMRECVPESERGSDRKLEGAGTHLREVSVANWIQKGLEALRARDDSFLRWNFQWCGIHVNAHLGRP